LFVAEEEKKMKARDQYVAFLKWSGSGDNRHLALCDSNAPEAFKVYRESALDISLSEDVDAWLITHGGSHQNDSPLTEVYDRGFSDAKAEAKCHDPSLCLDCAALVKRGQAEKRIQVLTDMARMWSNLKGEK
jgi:hypothetical protein